MKWNNLKENKCPQCNKDLSDKFDGVFFNCSCGFKISASKYKQIITNMVDKEIERG